MVSSLTLGLPPGLFSSSSVALSLEQQILAWPGTIGLWPLTETEGTTADNAKGDAALDGEHQNSPTLASVAFPVGDTLHPSYGGTSQRTNLYTAALVSGFNPSEGWMCIWFKDADPTNDYSTRSILSLYADFNNRTIIQREGARLLQAIYRAGGVQENAIDMYYTGTHWHNVVATWSVSGDFYRVWFDGLLWYESDTLGTWAGDLASTHSMIMATSTVANTGVAGSAAYVAIGAGQPVTDSLVTTAYETGYPTSQSIVFCGDSKTAGDGWPCFILGDISNSLGNVWREKSARIATTGWTVTQLHTAIDAGIGDVPGSPATAIINIGANDITASTSESVFKAQLGGCIDGLFTKSSINDIYIARIGRQGYDAECQAMNGWIDDVIAADANVHAGPNEFVWAKGEDDYATYYNDGVHYNDAGNLQAAALWYTTLGYS